MRKRGMTLDEVIEHFLQLATVQMQPKNPQVTSLCQTFPGRPGTWETKGINSTGTDLRPHIRFGGKVQSFSRLILVRDYGELDSDTHVLHDCWNGDYCVNPRHLRIGSHRDNMEDLRQDLQQFSYAPHIKTIWALREEGLSSIKIGRVIGAPVRACGERGVQCGGVVNILRGKNWRPESEQVLEDMGYEVEWSEGYRHARNLQS